MNTGEEGTLKTLRPKVSFPRIITDEVLTSQGLERVIISNEPVVLTLEEVKEKKLIDIRNACQQDIYSVYSKEKQLSAALDVYDATKKSEIKTFVKYKVDICNLAEQAVNDATTIEEAEAVYFRKENIDENTLEVLSVQYWGE